MTAKAMEVDGAVTNGAAKAKFDYEKVAQDIDRIKASADQGGLLAAVDGLLALEKQYRLAEDVTATRMACSAVLEVLFAAKEYQQLNEHIILLSKRRSQLKQAVQAFVRQAMNYIEQLPTTELRVQLLKTLQTVTEGKIYVEIERARLTRQLAKMKEEEGNVTEAAEILQEVAVETFGAMAKTEKIFYILEQVRLCLLREDYPRAQILLRKVSPRAFVDVDKKGTNAGEVGIEGSVIEAPAEGTPSLSALKLLYYQLCIAYNLEQNNYLEMARNYRAVYECKETSENEVEWQKVLKKICWLVVLAPSDSDQVTLLQLTNNDKRLAQLPLYKELLALFTVKEIIWFRTFEEKYAPELAADDMFSGKTGNKRREDLKLRVIEHNIMVISKYYSRLMLTRLSELLDLDSAQAEKHLSDMVVSGALVAKVDRPAGVVRFGGRTKGEDVLNKWSSNIAKLLDLVETACQQIQKEHMVRKMATAAA